MPRYARPATLDEALGLLSDAPGWRVVAGGTDVYPGLGDRAVQADLLDITGLGDLRGIRRSDTGWRIGALVTWAEVMAHPLPALFDGLKLAAREVGAIQIQNAGTVAGNVCNASPAADGTVALMALDAVVEIVGPTGSRAVPLPEFVLGSRQVALAPGELVVALHVPDPSGDDAAWARGHFLKLGARKHLVISIVMVAAVLRPDADGRIASAAVAVGACSPVAQRLAGLEARLLGLPMAHAASAVRDDDGAGLAPITDVRAPAAYREAAVPVLVRRCLAACGGVVS